MLAPWLVESVDLVLFKLLSKSNSVKSLKEGVPDEFVWVNMLPAFNSPFSFWGQLEKICQLLLIARKEKKMFSRVTWVSYHGGF